MFSGSYCHADEVAGRVAERLEYDRIEEKLLDSTASKFDVSKEKLVRALTGPPPFFNKVTREREKNIAYLRVALSELIAGDNKLLHGFACHLLPASISHVLKVCVIANHGYRIEQIVGAESKPEKEAHKIIRKDDETRQEWTRYLFEKSAYDESLYDMVLPMHDTSVAEAENLICETALSKQLETTPVSRRAADDFGLAAAVNLALVKAGHDVEVVSESGSVTIVINRQVVRIKQYQQELQKIASGVEGVAEVQTKIGPKYHAPSINPMSNIDVPPKILLVDDEKEFVHTLSERLQTRNLESSVVYNGEQALDFVNKDEPDVMVLDLMMPGIDGIEVLRRVKSEHPYVEVIILTGHGSEREQNLAEELGAFAYLKKPISIEVLTQTMNEAYRKVNKTKAAMRQESDTDAGERGE
jgi:CheY-like chemotaxis protein